MMVDGCRETLIFLGPSITELASRSGIATSSSTGVFRYHGFVGMEVVPDRIVGTGVTRKTLSASLDHRNRTFWIDKPSSTRVCREMSIFLGASITELASRSGIDALSSTGVLRYHCFVGMEVDLVVGSDRIAGAGGTRESRFVSLDHRNRTFFIGKPSSTRVLVERFAIVRGTIV